MSAAMNLLGGDVMKMLGGEEKPHNHLTDHGVDLTGGMGGDGGMSMLGGGMPMMGMMIL